MGILKNTVAASILIGLFCSEALSHGRFILPSHTMLSGEEKACISIQASISNDVFHPDMPFGNNEKGIQVNPKLTKVFSMLKPFFMTPNNEKKPMSYQAFNRYSVSDLTLSDKGTYGILIEQKPLIVTSFITANGEKGREFGPGNNLPEGTTNIKRSEIHLRSASYVSFNGISDIKPQNKGLELTGQHPNDLFTNEPATFQLLLNGKPVAKGTEINMIKEDTRHRNQRNIEVFITDENGQFSINFEQAGFYLLETKVSGPSNKELISIEQSTLYLTLEVFPE